MDMKKPFALCIVFGLCMMLFLPLTQAQAEDVFTINVDTLDIDSLANSDYARRFLSANTQGIRVVKDLQGWELPVRLTLTETENASLLVDKDYGVIGGVFDSGVLYLPYGGEKTMSYLVTLTVGDMTYSLPFYQLQPRLRSNGACTEGIRLRDEGINTGSDWMMGTMIDLHELESLGSITIPILATNRFAVGSAFVTSGGGFLTVTPTFDEDANVTVEQQDIYLITDCAALLSGIWPPAAQAGQPISTNGADTALLYMPLLISYDPEGLSVMQSGDTGRQRALFDQNVYAAGQMQQPAAPQETIGDGWIDLPQETFAPIQDSTGIDFNSGGWADAPAEGF